MQALSFAKAAFRWRIPLVATAAGLTLVLAVAAPSALADVTVEITEGSDADTSTWLFTPPEVSINVGEATSWTNAGKQTHTATATGRAFDTGLIEPNGTSVIRVAAPGTYPYICTLHPWMMGTLIVLAAGAAQPGAPPTFTPAPAAAQIPPAAAQAQATPTPARATPTPFRFGTPVTTAPTTSSAAPRAGGLPMELLLPLLAAGTGAVGGGVYLLRQRGARRR